MRLVHQAFPTAGPLILSSTVKVSG